MRVAQERGAVLVPPYDEPAAMAGQGTLALELVEQLSALEEGLDYVLVPCSGGGLLAGCSLVSRELSPKTLLYAVELEGFGDTAPSLRHRDNRGHFAAPRQRLARVPRRRTHRRCDPRPSRSSRSSHRGALTRIDEQLKTPSPVRSERRIV